MGLGGKKRLGPLICSISSASTLLCDFGQVTSSLLASESSSGKQALEALSTHVLFRWGCGGSHVLLPPSQDCSPGLGDGGHLGKGPAQSKLSDLWEQPDSSATADENTSLPTQERGHGTSRERKRGL